MKIVDHSLKMTRARSSDIVDHSTLAQLEVAIIGAGAIGSNVAYLLAKLGVGTLVIFDDDIVEEENLEPQMYYPDDVGHSKAVTTADHITEFVSDVVARPQIERVNSLTPLGKMADIIVSGVDSIESRKAIVSALMQGDDIRWRYYIDARMGGNIVELYLCNEHTIQDLWFQLLDAKPLEIPCSARATAYNGMVIASLVARYVAAISKGQPVPSYIWFDMLAWSFEQGVLQDTPRIV